ncbi:hypothetical protein [Mangrovibacterium lignilyticum]|uniref:hypothetical protein n=1 Tax=Mangrovibacterium lignilyticum TaxID=2668052 RepID=UPI0013D042AD|nr:hypothetical protein [Mangrovibacterium lignilyticum]
MKTTDHYLDEITEIKKMMAQSSRFLSLSGLSGVLVGIYALIGSFIAYKMIYVQGSSIYRKVYPSEIVTELIVLAGALLIIALGTVIWLTSSNIKKAEQKFWSVGSRLLLTNLAIPLITGGILILIFSFRGIYSVVAPFCLVFYGLALVNASKYTRQEIFYMGLLQIGLGLCSAILPGMGLLFWAIGFGIVHIIYGLVMYFRYERKTQKA